MILEWQIYFHTSPLYKEIVTYDGPKVEKGFITLSDKPASASRSTRKACARTPRRGVPFFG